MKKKCKSIVLLLMIAVLFCSCKEEEPVDSWEAVVGLAHTYMNEGVINTNSQVLRFYDVQSEQDVALCAKPNCEHLGASSTNPSPECNAYLGSYPDMVAIVGGQLYCVIQEEFTWDKPEGLFQKYLYRAEVDGTNRKEIAKFSDAQVSATADYGEGYFVYTYRNTEDVEGNTLEQCRAGIYLVDLKEEKTEQSAVYDGYQAYIPNVMVYNGKVYYVYSYLKEYMDFSNYEAIFTEEFNQKMMENICFELWEYDIKTKEQSCIRKGGNYNSITMNDGIICVRESDRATIINCVDGVQKEVSSEVFCNKAVMPYGNCIYFLTDGALKAYRVETGEVEDIGTYDESKLSGVGIVAITEETVYFMAQNGEEFYLSYDKFRKGKLDEVKKIEWQS